MRTKVYIWLLLTCLGMAGCESLEDTYSEHAGVSRYLGKCQNVEVVPGWKRLIVTWENHVDPVISNIKITWILNGEAKEILLDKGTTEYSIPDLENGVYEVRICSVDKDGNVSLPEIKYERPYASGHENVLSFTTLIEKHFFVGDRLAVFFSDWQSEVKKASLHYYCGGEAKTVELDSAFLEENKCYLVPDPIDPDSRVMLERSGYLAGCADLIDFDPYELSHTRLFSTEFRELCKKNYGVSLLSEEFIDATEELHYDFDVTSFEDILNFPNLKKLVWGEKRYLGNTYLDTYKSSSQVAKKERSEFVIRVAHELLGITVDSYNEPYFPRGTFDFVNYLGNPSVPEHLFLDAGDWECSETKTGSDVSVLFDAESTKGWVWSGYSEKECEIIVDMQEVQEVNGLQITQHDTDPKGTATNTFHVKYLAEKIKIAVAENKDEWSIPLDREEQALMNTSGETTIITFPTTQHVRYLRFTLKPQESSWRYGISLGKIRVF